VVAIARQVLASKGRHGSTISALIGLSALARLALDFVAHSLDVLLELPSRRCKDVRDGYRKVFLLNPIAGVS
jgi:hypothetical protein